MPTVEIIAIGTELLLGEISDTNTKYLARQLRDCGFDLFRSTTVGDNVQRISSLMQEAFSRADIVITTGGLGPTVDDPTREAAALAFHTQNEFHPELWEQIRQRFLKRAMNISDNNRKQAMIPIGAEVIENPVGTAPAFILTKDSKTLICLPGVPREMEHLMQTSVIPWLNRSYPSSGVIKAKILHIGAVSESKIDETIADLETSSNPTVGLLAHPGIVDIRITAKANSNEMADKMIADIESTIRERLGKEIYGENGETLIQAIQEILIAHNQMIVVNLAGFSQGAFDGFNCENVEIQTSSMDIINENKQKQFLSVKPFFYCGYTPTPEMAKLELKFFSNNHHEASSREYMGASGIREEWAVNYSLSFIRDQIISKLNPEEKNDPS